VASLLVPNLPATDHWVLTTGQRLKCPFSYCISHGMAFELKKRGQISVRPASSEFTGH